METNLPPSLKEVYQRLFNNINELSNITGLSWSKINRKIRGNFYLDGRRHSRRDKCGAYLSNTGTLRLYEEGGKDLSLFDYLITYRGDNNPWRTLCGHNNNYGHVPHAVQPMARAAQSTLTPAEVAIERKRFLHIYHQGWQQPWARDECDTYNPDDIADTTTAVAAYLNRRGLKLNDVPDSVFIIRNPEIITSSGELWNPAPAAMFFPLQTESGIITSGQVVGIDSSGHKVGKWHCNRPSVTGAIAWQASKLQSGGTLGIAEGPEDTLAILSILKTNQLSEHVPTPSAVWWVPGAGGISTFRPPNGCKKIILFRDADQAGEKSRDALFSRCRALGIQIRAFVPPQPAKDWNDALVQHKSKNKINHDR